VNNSFELTSFSGAHSSVLHSASSEDALIVKNFEFLLFPFVYFLKSLGEVSAQVFADIIACKAQAISRDDLKKNSTRVSTQELVAFCVLKGFQGWSWVRGQVTDSGRRDRFWLGCKRYFLGWVFCGGFWGGNVEHFLLGLLSGRCLRKQKHYFPSNPIYRNSYSKLNFEHPMFGQFF